MPAPLTATLLASVIIQDQDRVLVLYELDDDGVWRYNLPGGHVDPGEGIITGAEREALEETGYEVKIGELVGVRINSWTEKGKQSAKFVFYAERVGGELKTEEGTTARWITRLEVDQEPAERWTGASQEFIRLAFEGCKADPRSLIVFAEGQRVR